MKRWLATVVRYSGWPRCRCPRRVRRCTFPAEAERPFDFVIVADARKVGAALSDNVTMERANSLS